MSPGILRCVSDALYTELIDDAAMFPPRMADLDTALSERLTRRHSPADRFVGSFLVPAGCAAGLLDALGAESPPAPLPVGVIASDDTAATAEAIELLQRSDQVELALFETRLDPNMEPERALVEAASVAETSQCATKPRVLCEVPRTWLNDHRMVAAVTAASKAGLSMKLRTGGAAPEAFPTVAVVARFVAACVEHGVAFKCTAGLHHAVRHHDNWRHLPVGYHGRAGTVCISGTPIARPNGQRRGADGRVDFGPSVRLDIEAEIGFLVGAPSEIGTTVSAEDFSRHVFGLFIVNDWSARDIQAWEYQPLGPFLGKSFATSVSPWVVPLAALADARVDPPPQTPEPLPYLESHQPWGLDLTLEIALNGEVVSRPAFADMYWTPDQQLAHMTVNGARLRSGDIYASGTVSGPERTSCGSLIELTSNGASPLRLSGGATRVFLEDGDTVDITAAATRGTVPPRYLGTVSGTILPATV